MPRPVMRRHPASTPEPQVEGQTPTESSTKSEIVGWLEAHGIDAPSRATKAELLELLP